MIFVLGYVSIKLSSPLLAHLSDVMVWKYLLESVRVAAGAIAIATAMASVPAWLTDRYQFRGRHLAVALQLLPLTFPAYILALIYSEVPPFDFFTGRLALSFEIGLATAPWVFLFLRVALARIPRDMVDAARSLGLGPAQRLTRLYLPLITPFVIGAMLLVGVEAVGDFAAANALGVPTLSVGLYRQWFALQHQDFGLVMAAVTVILMLIVLIPAVVFLHGEGRPDFSLLTVPRAPAVARGSKAFAIHIVCLCAALPGFLIPLGLSGNWAWRELGHVSLETFYWDVLSTLLTAVMTVSLCFVIGLLVARFSELGERTGRVERANLLVILNFLMPPIILALVFLQIANWPLLQDTRFGVVLAQAARFLPFVLIPIAASLVRISVSFVDSARSLGCTKTQAFCRAVLPQLRVPLIAGAIVVFVESVNELTMSLLLQPFNYGALSLRIYSYSGMQMIHQASLWTVCSIILCIYPVWSLSPFLDLARKTNA